MTITQKKSTVFFKSMAMLMLVILGSCKKDADSPIPTTNKVEGLYVGVYGFGDEPPSKSLKYKIKAGGVLQEIGASSGNVVGEGNWELNGTLLTGIYTMKFSPFNEYSISANFNASTGTLTGTWGWDDPTDGGKMTLTKQ